MFTSGLTRNRSLPTACSAPKQPTTNTHTLSLFCSALCWPCRLAASQGSMKTHKCTYPHKKPVSWLHCHVPLKSSWLITVSTHTISLNNNRSHDLLHGWGVWGDLKGKQEMHGMWTLHDKRGMQYEGKLKIGWMTGWSCPHTYSSLHISTYSILTTRSESHWWLSAIATSPARLAQSS